MTIIQAYRRKATITQAAAGLSLVFTPNALGHVVCQVEDEAALAFLLGESTAFRVYDEPAEVAQVPVLSPVLTDASVPEPDSVVALVPAADAPVPVPSPYRMTDEAGNVVLDLTPMDDAALHAFAGLNGIRVKTKDKGDTLRDKIVAFLKTEA